MPTLLTPQGKREGGIRVTWNNGMLDKEEDWHYDVLADNKYQDRADILFNTPGLPMIGADIINNMLVKGGDAQRDPDHALRWNVTLTLSNSVEQNDANNGQQQGDPTLWVPVRRTMYVVKEEVVDTDASGNPIVNTADQPFETKMVRRRYCPAWEFTLWEPLSVTDEMILSRMEVMNNATWPSGSSRVAKTWMLQVVDSVVGFFAGYRCRMTTYRVVYDFKKWTDKRLSVGYLYKSSGNRFPYVVRGQVIQGPLTSAGDRVIDENGATISGRTLAIVELDMFPSVSFASITRIP